eukprot:Clim_evm85s88 gene=Clim_evmTU85s88
MKSVPLWLDKIQDREGTSQPVHCVAFEPGGDALLAAAGNRVFVYSGSEGNLIETLKRHETSVYALAWSYTGNYFASGSADGQVLVWSPTQMKVVMKFRHNDAVQHLAFDPTTNLLASGAVIDFRLWKDDQKSSSRHKTDARICSIAWSFDGQYLAFGLFNGKISIRGSDGVERVKLVHGQRPVWTLSWMPYGEVYKLEVLVAGDWSNILKFYQPSGRILHGVELEDSISSLEFYNHGEFFVGGTTKGKCQLYKKDGTKLATIGSTDGWVLNNSIANERNLVAFGSTEGYVGVYQIGFNTVHGLWNDRYAYREGLTDVIVHDLAKDTKARIQCRDMVHKISKYQNRLAIQLSDRILICRPDIDNRQGLKYVVKQSLKLRETVACNLLVVLSQNIVLCIENRLVNYDFEGKQICEWNLQSVVRYIKAIPGPPSHEGLLVGLKNGLVLKVFIDNPYPSIVTRIDSVIRCLDMNISKTKVAIIGDTAELIVYDLVKKKVVYKAGGATSVAWNTQFHDMLCYSGPKGLYIKTADFPVHLQKYSGFVVGFQASKAFCLTKYTVTAVDIPQSQSMYGYLGANDFEKAYEVACLGVTISDWNALGHKAILAMNFDIARKAFIRLKDTKWLTFIDEYGHEEEGVVRGYYFAFTRDFVKAKDAFTTAGYRGLYDEVEQDLNEDVAIKAAKAVSKEPRPVSKSTEQGSEVARPPPEDVTNSMEANDSGGSKLLPMTKVVDPVKKRIIVPLEDVESMDIEELLQGDVMGAIQRLGETGDVKGLVELMRRLPIDKLQAFQECGLWFAYHGKVQNQLEAFQKCRDIPGIVHSNALLGKPREARAVVMDYHDRFQDHQQRQIYLSAEASDTKACLAIAASQMGQLTCCRTVCSLIERKITMRRYADGSYLCWLLAQMMKIGSVSFIATPLGGAGQEDQSADFFLMLAEVYAAYQVVLQFMEQPFTDFTPLQLMHAARFLKTKCLRNTPTGISQSAIMFTLAQNARINGGFGTAKTAFAQLQTLRVPSHILVVASLATAHSHGDPSEDALDVLPVCPRCQRDNPVLTDCGNRCIHCANGFIHCLLTFTILNVVECVTTGVSVAEAEKLLAAGGSSDEGIRELLDVAFKSSSWDAEVPSSVLRSLTLADVFIVEESSHGLRYMVSCDPQEALQMCPSCHKLFLLGPFERQRVEKGYCAHCRTFL